MLKNDQRVYGQTSGGSKVLSFPKIPESNPLAMETFIYTLLSVIAWLWNPSKTSFVKSLIKQTENAVKNL